MFSNLKNYVELEGEVTQVFKQDFPHTKPDGVIIFQMKAPPRLYIMCASKVDKVNFNHLPLEKEQLVYVAGRLAGLKRKSETFVNVGILPTVIIVHENFDLNKKPDDDVWA